MKIQKPININCQLEYSCPNNNCYYTHWLTLQESQTKNFKIVCTCGTVFKPKQISKIDILYEKTQQIPHSQSAPEPQLNKNLLNEASCILQQYGFTRLESDSLLLEIIKNNQNITNTLELVKLALQSLEIKNV